MTRWQKIKLLISRGWTLAGKMRLGRLLSNYETPKALRFEGVSWLQHENILLYTNTKSYVEWSVIVLGEYETELARLIYSLVKEGDICLDIGANIGIQTLRMAHATKQTGKIISFEPVNYLRERLEKNVRLNRLKNVQIMPYALSNYSGIAKMNINSDASNQGTASLSESGNTEIEVRKGDEICEELELNKVDLIKIDVEGFEYQVLEGLIQTISKYRPYIIFEYDENYCVQRGQKSYQDFYEWFNKLNYKLYSINEVGMSLLHASSQTIESNILAIPD